MYRLRDYQQQAVDNAVKFFRQKKEPAVIVLPTGAGKSLVIAELARIARGRVLILAHVKELVEQNSALPGVHMHTLHILPNLFYSMNI